MLVAVLISAANAIVRKAFNYSSNAYLEIQWYLFSAIFLFGAGYTLLRNEHVRIDIIAGRLSARAQAGSTSSARVLPVADGDPDHVAVVAACSSTRTRATRCRPMPAGSIIWPARLMVPVGFLLLVVQGVSELIAIR